VNANIAATAVARSAGPHPAAPYPAPDSEFVRRTRPGWGRSADWFTGGAPTEPAAAAYRRGGL